MTLSGDPSVDYPVVFVFSSTFVRKRAAGYLLGHPGALLSDSLLRRTVGWVAEIVQDPSGCSRMLPKLLPFGARLASAQTGTIARPSWLASFGSVPTDMCITET